MSAVGSFFTSATISKATLLKPNPAANYSLPEPIGQERENNFDVGVNHRFSRGLVLNFGYGYFHSRYANSYFQPWNPNDPSSPQSLLWQPNNIAPNRFTLTWVYDLPFGKGRQFVHERVLSAIVGGWTFTGTYQWQTGTLITMPNAFYYGNPANIKLANPTLGEWFNTAGCVAPGQAAGPGDTVVPLGQPCTSGWEKRTAYQPGTYQARVMPLYVDGVRNPAYGQTNASLAKDFRVNVREHPITVQLRADVLNVLNHSYFNGPGTGVTSGPTSFGAITVGSALLNRFPQFKAIIRW
jgi:hypothetical protein